MNSLLQSLAKGSSSSSTSSESNLTEEKRPWTSSRLISKTSSASSSSALQFRSSNTSASDSKVTGPEQADTQGSYLSFLTEDFKGDGHSEYAVLDDQRSRDIELFESLDGSEVVALLEVMDTQEVGLNGY